MPSSYLAEAIDISFTYLLTDLNTEH